LAETASLVTRHPCGYAADVLQEGKFLAVDVKAIEPLPSPVTLAAIKAEPRLKDMALVKYSRLSVQPVTAGFRSVDREILEAAELLSPSRACQAGPSGAFTFIARSRRSKLPVRALWPSPDLTDTFLRPRKRDSHPLL